jgi:hypothetical protein
VRIGGKAVVVRRGIRGAMRLRNRQQTGDGRRRHVFAASQAQPRTVEIDPKLRRSWLAIWEKTILAGRRALLRQGMGRGGRMSDLAFSGWFSGGLACHRQHRVMADPVAGMDRCLAEPGQLRCRHPARGGMALRPVVVTASIIVSDAVLASRLHPARRRHLAFATRMARKWGSCGGLAGRWTDGKGRKEDMMRREIPIGSGTGR